MISRGLSQHEIDISAEIFILELEILTCSGNISKKIQNDRKNKQN